MRYLDGNSTSPTPPYTTWAAAAMTIQDAVDAAVAGDEIVVTNGTYATGGRVVGTNLLANRVAVDKPIALRSVNGPQFTVIQGYQLPGTTNGDGAIRCVCLANSGSLSGFTLIRGATRGTAGNGDEQTGGGVWCESAGEVVSNCVLSANSASEYGGGASGGTLYNCIVYFNTGPEGANYDSGTLNYCCTTPQPEPWQGVGNITNAPLFVDYTGGNLRLQSNSPCINAGNNAYAPEPTDLDGRPRILGGTVDIGAFEFQGPSMGEFIGWLQQYGLPTDGSADFTDPDADGHNDWQEWRCGTCPTNALSALRLLSASPTGTSVTVTWESVAGVSYFLERGTNLASLPPFSLLATNLPGQPGTRSFTDTNTAGASLFFYRVGVGQ